MLTMGYVRTENLLSSRSLVDTVGRGKQNFACQTTCAKIAARARADSPNHGDTNRPRSITDGQTEICIVCVAVFSFLHVMHDFGKTCQYVRS